MIEDDEPSNENSKTGLIKKIIVWLIVFLIVLMMVLIVIFDPKFYTFIDLITFFGLFI
jgi:hypothetical protein